MSLLWMLFGRFSRVFLCVCSMIESTANEMFVSCFQLRCSTSLDMLCMMIVDENDSRLLMKYDALMKLFSIIAH